MARLEEATLFRPDAKLHYPGALRGGGGGGRNGDEDDGPGIAVGAQVGEAARSAKRRKALTFLVMMICGALTVLGAIFAPRTYQAESRVLVQQTRPASETAAGELRIDHGLAREYEEQVMARDNIRAIVKQTNLVARWDDMRQPHRKVIDKINHERGTRAPTDDEKLDALVSSIEHSMTVAVDATTVTIKIDWSQPEAARDIVDAAVKRFFDTRYQSEVAAIPPRIKLQETFVAQAQKNLETAAADLVRLQSTAPKSTHEAQVRFDTATATLQTSVKSLQQLRMQLPEEEAQFKNRYKITHPADVPAAPKQPVATIAIAIGILSTIAAVLAAAALADRFSGIFYEPRKVRDHLGLPVFAAFS